MSDIHAETARDANVERRTAKMCNFPRLYGSPQALSLKQGLQLFKPKANITARSYMKLSEFLKMHGAYDEYTACYDGRVISAPHSAISAAFSWSSSPSGLSFWSRLDDEWHDLPDIINDMQHIVNSPFNYI